MSGLENKPANREVAERPDQLQELTLRGVRETSPAVEPDREVIHEISRESLTTTSISLSTPDSSLSLPRPSLDSDFEFEVQQQLEFEQELDLGALPAHELEMGERLAESQTIEGPPTRNFSFRGHSQGTRTPLDKLITALADFIKLLEVKLFRWLERRRVERIMRKNAKPSVKVVLPEEMAPVAAPAKKKRIGFRNLVRWS